jgi:DNA-binding NtrC family response regulator
MALILVVEDESVLLKNIERRLRLDGFKVLTALDGASARRALEGGQIDALCLDINLPDIDGLELLEEIRLTDPGLPAIIISGSATRKNRLRAEKLGARGFLRKPFRLGELSELLIQCEETTQTKRSKGVENTKRAWTRR